MELAHIHWANGSLELHITTKPRKRTTLELQVYPYAQSFLEAWSAGKLRMGEITITQSGVFVPFKQSLPLVHPTGVMFFDTNLHSLDFVVVTESGVVEGFSLDISLIQKIRERQHGEDGPNPEDSQPPNPKEAPGKVPQA
ncbi:MAG: hypothetical protein KIH08_10900 [Candidatus Freyarchaeota archaeon]|nr:hypothetical protein [Candidatus Jordarchaeia archaeon]MBS7270011.1 hypothetical protein [Candidatus Jordarchaeia archaeon]MBS7280833.1 hypothetical protein [Candidatus Jordarchaeia archaeon]